MKKTLLSRLSTAALLVAATFIAQSTDTQAQSGSSNFLNNSGDTTHVGMLNAGVAAMIDGATGTFNNSATLVRVKDRFSSVGGVILVSQSGTVGNGGTTTPVGAVAGSNNAEDFRTNALYGAATSYNNGRIALALGVYNPQLLDIKNDRNSFLRFNINNFELDTFAIKPAVSFAVTDDFSVGIDVGINYGRVEFNRAKMLSAFLGGGELGSNFVGDDWNYNIGIDLFYEWSDFNFGLDVNLNSPYALKGDYRLTSNTPVASGQAATNALLLAAGLNSAAATADLYVPNDYNFGVTWNGIPDLEVGFSVGVTQWGGFDEFKITNDTALPGSSFGAILPGIALDYMRLNFDDMAWNFALGAEYNWGNWGLQAGIAYEESPINPNNRTTVAFLGADTTEVALGINYEISGLKLNFAYAYGFVGDETFASRESTTFGIVNPNTSGANPVATNVNLNTNTNTFALSFGLNF